MKKLHLQSTPNDRFLTMAECQDIAKRMAGMAIGGGRFRAVIDSNWVGTTRVFRNEIRESLDQRDTLVEVVRSIRGGSARLKFHGIDDTIFEAAVRRAERWLTLQPQNSDEVFEPHLTLLDPKRTTVSLNEAKQFVAENERLAGLEAMTQKIEADVPVPNLFFDDTYNLGADQRAEHVLECLQPIVRADLVAACSVQVSATGQAIIDTSGEGQYCPTTNAQISFTVRSPDGTGSGWAGMNAHQWTTIDVKALTNIALDKCQRSINPVALEPGRYTTVLEPQATNDGALPMFGLFDLQLALNGFGVFSRGRKELGKTRINERVIDARITVRQDPMDPVTGFVPYGPMGTVYYPTTWIKDGVLKNLSYERPYAVKILGKDRGLPFNFSGLRVEGGNSTLDEMISTTRRGIYVTRFSDVTEELVPEGVIVRGSTRDGTWLIENGKISKPIRNLRFRISAAEVWNQIDLIGPSSRVFNPARRIKELGRPEWVWVPARYPLVPSLKVRDFNFVALSEAI